MDVEVKIPTIGESVTEVTLSAWLVGDGDFVEEGDNICEIESDKANMEIPAEISGTVSFKAAEGDNLKIGALIAMIAAGKAKAVEAEKPSSSKPYPSPAAGKILAEKGIEASEVRGSGREGRILKADALKADARMPKTEKKPPSEGGSKRGVRIEKVSRLRKTIARRLTEAKNSTAMLTTFNEVDMSAAMALRKTYNEKFQKTYGIKLGFMSLFTRACCLALGEVPKINARYGGDEITYYDYCDIGIAVSTPKGLVVPIVRDAQDRSLAELELEIKRLAERARDGRLAIDEMQGGTFTVTNGGVFGSMLSTPIINIPESAILGMHNIVDRPVAVRGEIVIRPVMYVALSYDHRLIDGRESVTFLKRVKEFLEEPARMLLGV